MNDQAFAALEYDELRSLLLRGTQTPQGRSRVKNLLPLANGDEVRASLAHVTEAVRLRQKHGAWTFSELFDPTETLQLLHIERATLDALTLLETARLCQQVLDARALIQSARDECPTLWTIVSEVPRELETATRRITQKILPGGEIDDRASPELARIRQSIARLRQNLTRQLESLMRREEVAIQDQLVTVRNDRFVIPVRTDHRGRITGVAHGFSSSGATVFVEPLQTIEANNELQNLRGEEEQEVARILASLSDELRDMLPALEAAARAVAELDFITAKRWLSERLECVEPVIDEASTLELTEARHPLLDERLRASGAGGAVPCSFGLNESQPVMIISGANAGGKTVVLKTAGLVSFMALSGLHVPAKRARVPLYRSVLADIGDRQSLAANLSTFTAHIRNIGRMIELCESPALVLLDEVGTGTDPEEGSALGVATVDHFRRQCAAHVVATTHYSGLKMYAASDDAVLNASVEFNERTLEPTYRLLTGLAGSSSGLEIAKRFGFPVEIIEHAREHVADSSRKAGEYLTRIKRESETWEELRRALEVERAAVAEEFASLDEQAAKRERERQREFAELLRIVLEDFEAQAKASLDKIEDRATRAVAARELEKRKAELTNQARRATQKTVNSTTSKIADANVAANPASSIFNNDNVRVIRGGERMDKNRDARSANQPGADFVIDASGRDIKAGDRVRLRSLGSVGTVERVRNDEAEIVAGSLRLREKLANLDLLQATAKHANAEAKQSRAASRSGAKTELRLRPSDENFASEINLIGRTTDEAVDRTDKFLDESFINGMSRIRIVHGMGTGALKRAIANFLQHHPHVARFSQAPSEQGGAGATVVELKS